MHTGGLPSILHGDGHAPVNCDIGEALGVFLSLPLSHSLSTAQVRLRFSCSDQQTI